MKKDTSTKICQKIKNKITLDNVLTLYSLAKLYKLATVYELFFKYIERCFQIVVETQNFLHLDFNLVAKILNSSELNIDSEVEIFNAVVTWLKHNTEERSKYAKHLLLKVRFTLLADPALRFISNFDSTFSKKEDFVKILKEVYTNRLNHKSSSCYTSRYCGQQMFNIILCGGFNVKRNNVVNTIIFRSDLNKTKVLSSMKFKRRSFQAVVLKGEIYFFGGFNNADKFIKLVEKYTPSTNNWSEVTNMLDCRLDICACAFIDKIYVFGGLLTSKTFFKNLKATNSCLQFDTIEENWKTKAHMNKARVSAACIAFQEKIVVSGGKSDYEHASNSVESYDVFANRWTSMPNMINNHTFHSLVVVADKLFVVGQGTESCEVFDNVCKKFVVLKHHPHIEFNKSLSIGKKIVIFQRKRSSIVYYDVDKDEWSEESSEVTKNLIDFCYVKFPWY